MQKFKRFNIFCMSGETNNIINIIPNVIIIFGHNISDSVAELLEHS